MTNSVEIRERFENWFLSLDRDFGQSELSKLPSGGYFFVTTQALYKQFCEIEKLKAALESIDNPGDDIEGNGLKPTWVVRRGEGHVYVGRNYEKACEVFSKHFDEETFVTLRQVNLVAVNQFVENARRLFKLEVENFSVN